MRFISKDEILSMEIGAAGLYFITLKGSGEIWCCKKFRADETGLHGIFSNRKKQ